MEPTAKPVEGENDDQETATTHGGQTVSQMSCENESHASLLRSWKRQLLEYGPEVFYNHGSSHQSPDHRKPVERHYAL